MSKIWKSLSETDFSLLAEQKEALVKAMMTKEPVPEEVLDGLVNFLDAIMDEAEENHLF